MKRTISIFSLLVIMGLLISACAIPQTGGTTQTPTPATTADSQVVTLADNGGTIQMKVGESFLLKLGNDYTWQISLSNQDVIGLRKGVMVILGAQGIYDALQPGTVQLTATGDPQCRQSTPACAAPSILFNVTIDVSQ